MTRKTAGNDWVKNVAGTVTASVVVFVIQNHFGPTPIGQASHKEHETSYEPQAVKAEACRFYERGLECSRQGRFSEAVADYGESLRLDSSFAPAYLNPAEDFGRLAQFDRMATDCSEAIGLDRTCALAYANRGWAYAKLGLYDRSIADCSEAMRLDPNLMEASAICSWATACRSAAASATPQRPNPGTTNDWVR
jgi:tetratricopeptide (TPR) repeat protein